MSRAVCEECGYDLAGLGRDDVFRCPECGATCDPIGGFRIHPMPPAWKIALRLLAPGIAFAITIGVTLSSTHTRNAVFISWPLLIGFWVMLGIGLPLDYARALAARTRTRPRRQQLVLVLTIGAGLITLLSTLLAVCLGWLWRW